MEQGKSHYMIQVSRFGRPSGQKLISKSYSSSLRHKNKFRTSVSTHRYFITRLQTLQDDTNQQQNRTAQSLRTISDTDRPNIGHNRWQVMNGSNKNTKDLLTTADDIQQSGWTQWYLQTQSCLTTTKIITGHRPRIGRQHSVKLQYKRVSEQEMTGHFRVESSCKKSFALALDNQTRNNQDKIQTNLNPTQQQTSWPWLTL